MCVSGIVGNNDIAQGGWLVGDIFLRTVVSV